MTDEELVEKLRAAISAKSWEGFEDGQTFAEAYARTALAVFREHTAPRYADSAEVRTAAEKIVGENRELLDRLAEHTAPTDDDREALIQVLSEQGAEYGGRLDEVADVGEIADAIQAAGFRRGAPAEPVVTEEMVERAISAHRFTNAFGPEEVTRMRAALEAALSTERGEK